MISRTAPSGEVATGFEVTGSSPGRILLHFEGLRLAAAACAARGAASLGFSRLSVAELAVTSSAAPSGEVTAGFEGASSPDQVFLHSECVCFVAGLLPGPCLWRREEGETEAVAVPRKLILNPARHNTAMRNANDRRGGLSVRDLALVPVTPAPHGEGAHFTELRQGCSEGGGCQELRASDMQANVGGGRAQHVADHRLGESVDGGGVLGGSCHYHDAAGRFVRCEMGEVEWPRESATQS